MSRSLSFHPLAEDELNEAAAYYESAREGLGFAFLDAVEGAIASLLESPGLAHPVNRRVRKKLVRRFPYGILYSFTTDDVRILAIAHHRRRPYYWRRRK